MNFPRLFWIIILFVILSGFTLGWWLWPEQKAVQELPVRAADVYHFEWVDCGFRLSVDVQCGRLHTPVNTGAFSLAVSVIRGEGEHRHADPVLYIPGGPGGASGQDAQAIRDWSDWLFHAAPGRDLVLMDPRGTGHSLPRLTCDEYESFSEKILARNASLLDELVEGEQVLRQCMERLSQTDFDPEYYGTRLSAQDIAALMDALSYEWGLPDDPAWNLFGGSYGTRVAMLIPEYSERVRSLILDSVYPPDQPSFRIWPELLGQAFDGFFEWCRRSDCYDGLDLETYFYRALQQLKVNPVTLRINRWDNKPPMTVVINDQRLVSAVFSGLYYSPAWERIPRAIDGILFNSPRRAEPLIESWINNSFDDSFSSLVFTLVDCQDEPAGSEQEYQTAVNNWPQLADYTRHFWAHDSCRWLMPNPVPLAENWQPPSVPTLILAGAQDPITPGLWAEQLHARWPGSQLWLQDGVGHGVSNSEFCVLESLSAFLDKPEEPWAPACD